MRRCIWPRSCTSPRRFPRPTPRSQSASWCRPRPAAAPTSPHARSRSQLSRAWGRQVVVDNRPSPAANIAAEVVSKAPADGYTLLLTTQALAINPLFNAKLPYDAARDFVPVGATMRAPLVLLVQPALAVKSVRELVAMAAAQPDKLNYGHSGSGSAGSRLRRAFQAGGRDTREGRAVQRRAPAGDADAVSGAPVRLPGSDARDAPRRKRDRRARSPSRRSSATSCCRACRRWLKPCPASSSTGGRRCSRRRARPPRC